MNLDLYKRCMLEGYELDQLVAVLEGYEPTIYRQECHYLANGQLWPYSPSTDEALAMRLMHRDLMWLEPPADRWMSGRSVRRPELQYVPFWAATVSTTVRERPNPIYTPLALWTPGRGLGETPMLAICRAYVDSKAEGWRAAS